MSTTDLNERFGITDKLVFNTGNGGLERAVVTADAAQGEIYLHGAHVTDWRPHGHEPVLWMSGESWFAPDKPIRGGVPICFPWFGTRAGDPDAPSHGTARLRRWDVQDAGATPDGGVFLTLGLAITPFHVSFTVTFEATLKMTLAVTAANTVDTAGPFRFEEALHTYFNVSDVRQIQITGLEGVEHLDQLQDRRRIAGTTAPIRFEGEVDRIYPNSPATVVIEDPGLGRRIAVEKVGSFSTVVWNPHIAKAGRMPDFGNDEWPGMVCVETANVGDAAVSLEPGTTHEMTATLRVDRL